MTDYLNMVFVYTIWHNQQKMSSFLRSWLRMVSLAIQKPFDKLKIKGKTTRKRPHKLKELHRITKKKHFVIVPQCEIHVFTF